MNDAAASGTAFLALLLGIVIGSMVMLYLAGTDPQVVWVQESNGTTYVMYKKEVYTLKLTKLIAEEK